MSDETTHFILGDAGLDATGQPRKRRFFRRKKSEPQPITNCENCGADLTGEYCAKCGQHAIDYRRSVWRVMVDAADSIFNWDTKFLKSVGVLLVRPWKLTIDFNAGRRVRYVHPLRLYLLASIAFFLIARLINLHGADAFQFDPKDRAEMEQALAKLAAPTSDLPPEARAKVEAARLKLSQMNGPLTDEDKKQMRHAFGTLIAASVKEKLKEKDRVKLDRALDSLTEATPAPNETPTADQSPPTNGAAPAPTFPPKEKRKSGVHFSDKDDEHKTPTEKWLENRIREKVGADGTKAQLFLDTLRSNIPSMMLCCIPLFALILKILYIRKGRYYIEHLVYSLHIHSFTYIAVVVITLLAMLLARWSAIAEGLSIGFLSAAAVVLVFLSIRRVYGQGWFLTAFKFFAGGVAYFVILITAVAFTAFITLLLPN